MQYQDVFCRKEKKYMLTSAQYRHMREGIIARGMRPDEFGLHTIASLYYDTPDYQLIRRSLEKPVYKEKLRLRAYGSQVLPDDTAYVEIKKKFKGVVYKRRIAAPLPEAVHSLREGIFHEDHGQIGREINFFLQRYDLHPACWLGYEREAFFSDTEDVRITFDENIRFRTEGWDMTLPPAGQPLLDEGLYLMEVKIPFALPLWLVALMNECGIFSRSFSKYGTVYMEHIHSGAPLHPAHIRKEHTYGQVL
ncbi:MAG: polyphosphate polymerase domain-containing protein [Clostridiales bacterium]|nr:polyphosphate polymerase domain-containing protein [Clostridiales bacterium]